MSSEIKEKLVEELRFCAEKIITETDLNRKLFLLERTSEIIGSYLFFDQDEDLIFTEFTLEVCHGYIDSKIEETDLETDTLLPDVLETLDEIAKQLVNLTINIEKGIPFYPTLKEIVIITHSFSDPGIYNSIKTE
jgi:RNA processing factor Prp31